MSAPARETPTFLDQHAAFGACGMRAVAYQRSGTHGPIYRLRWAFVERQSRGGGYSEFGNSIGLETPPNDLAVLARTLTGERSEARVTIARQGAYKELHLRYQPDHPSGPFNVFANLRDGERTFRGGLVLGEYDAFRLLWLIGVVLGAESQAAPRVMLDCILRVGCRSETVANPASGRADGGASAGGQQQ